MNNNFDEWNNQKKILNSIHRKFFFKEGEIWWCSIGLNIVVEEFGKGEYFKRPVLVLKKLDDVSFIGIPITTSIKNGSWFIIFIVKNIPQTFLLNQIRTFSTNRFQRRFAALNTNDFNLVKRKLEQLLKLS